MFKFIYLPILIISIVLHELGHAYVAKLLGDDTASKQGRLTLNPFKHLDLVGSLLLPLLLTLLNFPVVLGWAKPVPINVNNFINKRKGLLAVSIAGIAMNFCLVFLGVVSFNVFSNGLIKFISLHFIFYNLVLGIFNLIPIPPLDGSKIIMSFLPNKYIVYYKSVEPYGLLIVFAFLYFGFSKYLYYLVNILMQNILYF